MNIVRKCLPYLLAIVAVAGVFAIMQGQPVQAVRPGGGIQCPLVYAPVICKGGKIYSNQCFADRAHAKDCVPYGEI